MVTWQFGSLSAEPGTKVQGHLAAPGIATPLSVHLIHGSSDGPTVLVLGGIHGCEYTSIDAALSIARELTPEQVKGRVAVIPIANPDSFYARSIYVHPRDKKNLNRSFPGDPQGTEAEQLADFLYQTAFSEADVLIDLHGGDMIEALVPFSIYHVTGNEELDNRAADMAGAFGIPYVIASTGQVPGSTYGALAEAGKLAMIAEAGQQGILSLEWSCDLQEGVKNVLRKLHVLDGEVASHEYQVLSRFDWYRADISGLWYPTVQCGEYVNEGQIIGEIRDEFGDVQKVYTAHTAGTALFLVTSLAINKNDPLLALGDCDSGNIRHSGTKEAYA